MSCALTQSLLENCTKTYVGGVSEVYLCEFDALEGYTESDASGVTAISLDEGKQFFKYQFVRNSASFVDAFESGDNGGGVTPTITMNLKGLRQAAKLEIETLARLTLIAIVKDKNGQYLLVGAQNGLTVQSVSGQTGQQLSDLNGYNALTLVGEEPLFAKFVDPAIIPGLLVPAE